MTRNSPNEAATLAKEIATCEGLCRTALASEPLARVASLPAAPADPQAAFDLLYGVPFHRASMRALRLLRQTAECQTSPPHTAERLVILKAYLVTLPRLASLELPPSIIWQFCTTCRQVACTKQQRDARLALESDAFAELARIVTLRRFHAGQLSFDVGRMPRAWLLKVHPFDVCGFLRELCFHMRGIGPMVVPHLNYWRANPMFMLKGEQELAVCRIAQFVERHPEIRGLVASSWLYGTEVGEGFPHLAWIRDFFASEKTRIIDSGPALPDAGFMVGSARRRQNYSSGIFRPREAIVLWPRQELLAWARNHRETVDGASEPAATSADAAPRARPSAPSWRWRSGRWTLIDGRRLLFYWPRSYIALVFLLPALLTISFAGMMLSATLMLPTFLLLFICLWGFQYFFLQ